MYSQLLSYCFFFYLDVKKVRKPFPWPVQIRWHQNSEYGEQPKYDVVVSLEDQDTNTEAEIQLVSSLYFHSSARKTTNWTFKWKCGQSFHIISVSNIWRLQPRFKRVISRTFWKIVRPMWSQTQNAKSPIMQKLQSKNHHLVLFSQGAR